MLGYRVVGAVRHLCQAWAGEIPQLRSLWISESISESRKQPESISTAGNNDIATNNYETFILPIVSYQLAASGTGNNNNQTTFIIILIH